MEGPQDSGSDGVLVESSVMKSPKSKKQTTIVIKLGTSSIVDEQSYEPMLENLHAIVETVMRLRRDNHKVIIVSSGAIGVGLHRMGIGKKPKFLSKLQAVAAIGQCRLIGLWDSLFAQHDQAIGQILITRNDIADYLNAQNTFTQLLEDNVIPIVNENDTIAVTEIKFGDNDTLSAITAAMVHADYLFLMTDVDCLYDKNPRTNPDAKPVEVVEDILSLTADVSSSGSKLGTGGMATKLVAARLAASAGVTTVITRSSLPQNIISIVRHVQSLKRPSSLSTSSYPGSPSSPRSPASRRTHPIPPVMACDPSSTQTTIYEKDQKPGKCATDPTSIPSTHLHQKVKQGTSSSSISTSSSTPATPTLTPLTNGSNAPSEPLLPDHRDFLHPPQHTRFIPTRPPIRDRYVWLLWGLAPHGTVYIDRGAYRALLKNAGLLAVGVVCVEGNFQQQEAVKIVVVDQAADNSPSQTHVNEATSTDTDLATKEVTDAKLITPTNQSSKITGLTGLGDGVEVGRALVNYSAVELDRIKGVKSSEIGAILGYADSEYVALRENISFFDTKAGKERA